jgi:hypothetical protein
MSGGLDLEQRYRRVLRLLPSKNQALQLQRILASSG